MIKPFADRVLVRRDAPPEKTGSIILNTAMTDTKPQYGEVLAVGPGARNKDGVLIEMTIQAGDRIYFEPGGIEVEVGGEKLLVLRETEIVGVIEV